jgi:hypothetical protein
MKKIIFIGAILLLFGCNVAAMDRPGDPAGTAPQDVADIQRVMETFHHAVATHDGEGVSGLFLDHGSTWVTVLSDKAFAARGRRTPRRRKSTSAAIGIFPPLYRAQNRISILAIPTFVFMSDGAVASVYFHFDFVIDGKVENRGDETWQLVKTVDGWRIVAITYSSNPGAA